MFKPLIPFLIATSFALPVFSAEMAKPNVIFILADDLGYGDVGCYGQTLIKTPNIDALAKAGVRFTDAYAGAPVCAPSRASLMTGLHAGHARVRGNPAHSTDKSGRASALQDGERTLASVFKDAGYATGLVGKWGMGDFGSPILEAGLPRKHGFDYFFGYLNQTHAHNSYPSYLWRNETKIKLPNIVPDERPVGSGVSSNKVAFSEDLFINEAEHFVRDHQKQPFFLYFAPTLPHANNESEPIGLEVPSLGDYAGRDWPEAMKRFAAMVTRLDTDVGRIAGLVHELGLEKNTIIVFASDNGPHDEGGANPAFFNSWGPLRGIKRDMYEGGIREPMIVRWPEHTRPGTTDATPWYFADFLPTFAEITRQKLTMRHDGVSVLPLWLGKAQPELLERPIYWEFFENGFKQAARKGSWKAVRASAFAQIEIYDLSDDIGEKHNLATPRADKVAEFEKIFHDMHEDSPAWVVPVK